MLLMSATMHILFWASVWCARKICIFRTKWFVHEPHCKIMVTCGQFCSVQCGSLLQTTHDHLSCMCVMTWQRSVTGRAHALWVTRTSRYGSCGTTPTRWTQIRRRWEWSTSLTPTSTAVQAATPVGSSRCAPHCVRNLCRHLSIVFENNFEVKTGGHSPGKSGNLESEGI